MKKELKDYLHLYLGCDVSLVLGIFELIGIEENAAIIYNKMYGRKVYSVGLIKPILRPLSDMKEEEKKELWQLIWADSDLHNYRYNRHEVTKWLLSKHFDHFGLIEAGLAIDKTTIKP